MTKAEYSKNNMAGMTMANFAPEIVHGPSKTVLKMSDVYPWAISGYKILCNHSSPWANVFPVLNDTFIFQALSRKQRPSLDQLLSLYDDKNLQTVMQLIDEAWIDSLLHLPQHSTDEIQNVIVYLLEQYEIVTEKSVGRL